MQNRIDRSRRRFMCHAGLGALAVSALPGWVRAMEMQAMAKLAPNRASPGFNPDVEIDMAAQPGLASILPGPSTQVVQYVAQRVKGPDGTVAELPGSYLGPLLRLHRGQKVRINFRSKLAEPTIVHWHGLHVPAVMDGHPMHVIDNGETYVYEFEVLNRAGLHIYHPHPHELLGKQLYQGLAGGIIVNDEEESKLELPSGEYEIPIIIQDRRFDAQNRMAYVPTMHDRMMGYYGDRILVNGRPEMALDVASRAYRLRFLNGSNARIYKLGWSDGTPITVIGVDGGLLETPETLPYVMLAPGERLDVWADFSGRAKGSEFTLRSLPFQGVLPKMAGRMMGGGMGGMGGGMMAGMALPVGSDFPIFKVRVTRTTSDSPKLPGHLSSFKRYTLAEVANPAKPIPIGISEAPMAMLLNGRPYKFDDVQPNERIPVDTVQLLEIFHAHGGEGGGHGAATQSEGGHGGAGGDKPQGGMGGGMMGGMGHGMMGGGMGGMGHGGGQSGGMGMMGGMGGGMMLSMAHPIHLHGQQFQTISRGIGAGEAEDYATVKDGFIDSGLKDTVLVMPGEKVRIIKPFQDFKGLFVYHCHNIEHEDMGMMRDFLVE
ncbi:Multicopper oxidase with three cupredoxin domains (includes cell division protein FtsP and spore coat protein CotA) [Methylomagnum ishizawai]|uniref:Multicopper oxidase CueO n=1 Tax=Methylomagnum ishizawai TaxID=1760988 RepID=A0A1Y6CYG5_9GAMM|nr:multicopper oxidase domain-containing protein [Methylomagnum ishizawai]SMF95417.1 Multicopper oxidase with three cupredoxin domains (includes cell division protein FtsP and spore coat protein CotA) [Methylomagnum ishizawai]